MIGHIETDREKRVAQILATDTTREQLADALWCAEDCVRRLVERNSLLNDKSSKLRELMRDMFDGMCDHDHCYTCHHWKDGYNGCEYHERMAQLVVEVDS